MIGIDGSYLEGGGQIIRTAVALSAITGESCKIENIRYNRPNPGLQAQHLTAVKSVARLCGTDVNVNIGDTSFVFEPKEIRGGSYEVDIGTAGAISLVIQSLMLPSLHAKHPVEISLKGGTHVKWSPSMDYMKSVFSYYMKKIGIDFSLNIENYGFFPKGGGMVKVKIKPATPKALTIIDRGKLIGHEAVSVASEDLRKNKVAERQVNAVENFFDLEKKDMNYVPSLSTGSSIHVSALFENCILGESSLGERGKKAEEVGSEAAIGLKNQINGHACLDKHIADQLLPFLAFAKQDSSIRVSEITPHVLTNIWVIEQFLPVKFNVNEKDKIIEVKVK